MELRLLDNARVIRVNGRRLGVRLLELSPELIPDESEVPGQLEDGCGIKLG